VAVGAQEPKVLPPTVEEFAIYVIYVQRDRLALPDATEIASGARVTLANLKQRACQPGARRPIRPARQADQDLAGGQAIVGEQTRVVALAFEM
jgi:hypothetical protein